MSEIPLSTILAEFHSRLGLSDAHRDELMAKRGFSLATIAARGYRSSVPENRVIIEELVAIHGEAQLAKLDLVRRKGDRWRPSPQFCGYGKTGKKDENGEDVWSYESRPILIPYHDESGVITFLRPHKGFPKKDSEIDDYDESYVSQPVYCPQLLRSVAMQDGYDSEGDWCILTEGEYKADALWQCAIPGVALPGIQAVRSSATLKSLVEMLNKFGIRRVVVVFDNECKDDPSLPGYKPDPWDRYDTPTWAKYACSMLKKEGFKATIGVLPDEWRERGKADWDGALARFVREKKSVEAGTAAARKEFLRVAKKSMDDKGALSLFPTEGERIIEAKLNRLFRPPDLAFGNDDVVKLGRRLRTINSWLGKAFLDCHGRYFVRKCFYSKSEQREAAQSLLLQEKKKDVIDWLKVRELEELLAGIPTPISTFVLFCDYRLHTSRKTTEYLVRAVNINNEKTTQHKRLRSVEMAKLSEFRRWCIEEIGSTWSGGERDLQALTGDIQSRSAHREIFEIEGYGWHKDTGMWKFADRAFTRDGKLLLPDKNQVFWLDGIGYQTDFDLKRLGYGFEQGPPILGDYDENQAARSFLLLSRHVFDLIGDYGGWLALGSILAYAAHPEIHQNYGGAPGLWITGRKGGGKSTLAQWLMAIFGFPGKMVSLTGSTTGVFVNRELAKYYCLPIALDEFKDHVTREDVKDHLKNAFGRSASGKGVNDGTLRTHSVPPNTTPIVLGETGIRDSATRQRYVQLTLIDEKSKGDPIKRLNEMREAMPHFRNLGQFLMLNRPRFVQKLTTSLATWMSSGKTDEFMSKTRDKLAYGTAYCAWCAAADLLIENGEYGADIHELANDSSTFESQTLEIGSECQSEVAETTYVSQFWEDIHAMAEAGDLEVWKYFEVKYATVKDSKIIEVPTDFHMEGKTMVLLMAHDAIYWIYEQAVRARNRTAPLSKTDLRRELRREKYWLRSTIDQPHRKQIDGERHSQWAFDLLAHPIGEEIQAILKRHEKTS